PSLHRLPPPTAYCNIGDDKKRAAIYLMAALRTRGGNAPHLGGASLEVETERQLHLTARPKSDGRAHGLRQLPEVGARRGLRERLSRLNRRCALRRRRQRVVQREVRVREVGEVEQVEHFEPNLRVAGLAAGANLLGHDQVDLLEARSMQHVAGQIAE